MMKNDTLQKIIEELAKANDELLKAVRDGDQELLNEVLNRVSLIEQRRNKLVKHDRASQLVRRRVNNYESSVPLRDQIIRALYLVSSPSTGRLLANVTKARWDEQIDTTKLSSLRRDEYRSWCAGQDVNRRTALRDIYIVPALSYDRFAPVRGTLALSTWEVSKRLIAPLSPRVDMLKSTIALAYEANKLEDSPQKNAISRLVGQLGATIPGIKPFESSAHDVILAAQAELSEIEEIDSRERATAAKRAVEQLSPESLLFGSPLQTVKSGKVGAVQ